MTRPFFIWALILALTLAATACNGQVKTSKENTGGQAKLIKNHFIAGLDEVYLFVQCGLQDKAGNMWFGTAGNGIYVYDGNSFVNFTHKSFTNFSLKDDLNHNDVLSCLEDKAGNIWFGTRRGLIRYKPATGKPDGKDFTLFLIPENTVSHSARTRLPYTFQTGDNFVWSILQAKSGKLWFGTSKGIYTHNPATDFDQDGPLFRRFLETDGLINDRHLQLKDVSVMLQDGKGDIWFASAWTKNEGIVRYDGKSLTNFTPNNIQSFRSVIERKNGELLFLSPFNGVYAYDGRTFTSLNEKIGLKTDTLVSMMEDKNGNLWFGQTNGNVKNGGDGGLWRYDGRSLKLFTTKDGLLHNHVFCMVPDRDGNIWFGSRNTGLCKFNGKTFTDFTGQ